MNCICLLFAELADKISFWQLHLCISALVLCVQADTTQASVLLTGILPVNMLFVLESRNSTSTSKQVEVSVRGTASFHPVLWSEDLNAHNSSMSSDQERPSVCRLTFVISLASTSGANSEEASQSSELTAQIQGLTSEVKYFPENGTVDTEGMQMYNGTVNIVNEAAAKLHAQLATSLFQFRCDCPFQPGSCPRLWC